MLRTLLYFYTPIGILATTIGILLGGDWVWLGIAIFGLNIVLDTLTAGIHTKGAPVDADGNPSGTAWFLNLMMYLQLPSFIALQVAIVWRIFQYISGAPIEAATFVAPYFNEITYMSGITGWGLFAAVVGGGLHQGLGIMFGHELSHTKGIGFLISRLMMGLSGCAAFCFAHVYNHHLELGRAWLGPQGNKIMDDTDPATAPRGRSLYKHWVISTIGQSLFGYRTEQRRLKRMGKSFFSLSNRWIRGYLLSIPTIVLFGYGGYLAGGQDGALFSLGCMLVIWVISTFELEALNYMEHYGLIRVKDEPIEYRHSWDNDNVFTSLAFIEIGRQADHHDRGETHFWELSKVGIPSTPDGAPNAMMGYYTEFLLALVPPLWHAVYKKKLAIWDRDFASDEERAIAREINRKVGYEVDPSVISNRKLEVGYV